MAAAALITASRFGLTNAPPFQRGARSATRLKNRSPRAGVHAPAFAAVISASA